ncbi:hypothetical protein BT96DRAFT_913182 [Gymnopus androsaceus JB14]|uniref:Uncharacterized protein n=1 Tax=Gymnopus androsaceus JB14 TaxID=1447944 RepID=A0A6A4IGF1_9AGAR|nr:hypothetical protein BT96DRAFT_913182 [Gymnopus androsaceus JB14]
MLLELNTSRLREPNAEQPYPERNSNVNSLQNREAQHETDGCCNMHRLKYCGDKSRMGCNNASPPVILSLLHWEEEPRPSQNARSLFTHISLQPLPTPQSAQSAPIPKTYRYP